MLTAKQAELLRFIHRHVEAEGVSPSFEEMKEAVGLKSKSGIHRLIIALEERGFLRRLPHRARALEVLRLPPGLAAGDADNRAAGERPAGGFTPRVIEGDGPRPDPDPEPDTPATPFMPPAAAAAAVAGSEIVSLPLYGRIAAGTPIEALRDPGRAVELPAGLLGPGDHYALEVAGDSMVGAGILDGDMAIIRRADRAETGEIVVALIDDGEVTLKRLRRRGDSIALEPANPDHETRLLPPERVQVQGRLVTLIRQY